MADNLKELLSKKHSGPANAVIFLSGSGSNAEEVLKFTASRQDVPYTLKALVTDAPETSRARELGQIYHLPVIEEDIRKFYHDNGEKRVSIATPRGQVLRQQWTDKLRERLKPLQVDFAIFAGFVPLTNIAEDFPCLNVHPGDLTYLKNGARYLVGLHTIPVERAILEGLDYLRSSVILVRPYSGKGEDMDNGALLGISEEVPVDVSEAELAELRQVAASRPTARPVGGYQDKLAEVAKEYQERLKVGGDWKVLPRVVWDFASGRYAEDAAGQLYYRLGQKWHPVETVIFSGDSREPIFAGSEL